MTDHGLPNWPRIGDALLGPDGQRKFHINVADMGNFLPSGYKDAGDTILEAFVESRGSHRDLLLPALFCYRQYLELKIKRITSRIHHYLGTGATDYRRIHDLEQLWRDMEQAYEEAGYGDSDEDKKTLEQTRTCVSQLNKLDPSGLGFRYPNEVGLFEVDPFHLHKVMTDIDAFLDAFLDFVTGGER